MARIVVRIVVVSASLAWCVSDSPTAVASGWSVQRSPAPAGIRSRLNGVSCASASACIAVGVSYTSTSSIGPTLAERWNGRRWSIQPTPGAGQTPYGLAAVSCASPSMCFAVGGEITPGGVLVQFVDRWNGRRWSVEPTPPAQGILTSVSCASPIACTAIGIGDPGDLFTAERWNGKRWSIQTTPRVAVFVPSGVSCASATACTAVGFSSGIEWTPGGSFAAQWDGRKGSTLPSPTGQATGVSCMSASSCMAVTANSLAERWNGIKWSVEEIPGTGLSSVSCPSTQACTAVGGETVLLPVTSGGTLAERWNGTRWSHQPVPHPAAGRDVGLAAVSCPTTTACTAVGSYYDETAGKQLPLIERWNAS